ncbi:MAG: hypothetical protein JWS12_672 [Candidatus Saccharibacteria bacterium]|nr:hypothetical protein [Candidatus Saccharibacteria bacterium]
MRIIGGGLGGQQFEAPKGHRTHPMSDKARGGLFNVLGDIEGLSVLDAFGGSGALGFEALSRGATSALIIDSDRNAQTTIEHNIANLKLKNARLVRANVSGWSDNNPEALFDLIFLDPPYDHTQTALLAKLARHLSPAGTLVLSWPAQTPLPALPDLRLVKQSNYGDAELAFYQAIKVK